MLFLKSNPTFCSLISFFRSMLKIIPYTWVVIISTLFSCQDRQSQNAAKAQSLPQNAETTETNIIKPLIITDTVQYDTDDPAVWINYQDPAQSLIIGTDKAAEGGLFVFNLDGKIMPEKTKKLQRPDNVDVEYGLQLNGKPTDIAVTTERLTHKLRIYALPNMKPIDNGGIEVFAGETGEEFRALMGIALYKNKAGSIYAIVGRKSGPTNGTYLWQYLLTDDGTGHVQATLKRKFGAYSGKKEIEAIAVDDALGYIYYSDEGTGVRKYYADPEKGNQELALFAGKGFREDHEGISIYQLTDSTGYILVSDQQANRFHIFTREGSPANPHDHKLMKIVNVGTNESDGSEVVSVPLNANFKHGLFIAMSADKTFQLYRWEDIAGKELQVK